MIKEIDHIAIAVDNLEEAIKFYRDVLQLEFIKKEIIEDQKIVAAFFKVGSVDIELITPTDETSTVARFLAQKGQGIHHIAYKVNTIEADIEKFQDSGIKMVNVVPVIGAGGKKIAFLHPKSTMGVLTEICQKV